MRSSSIIPRLPDVDHFDHFMDAVDAVKAGLPRHVRKDTEILHLGAGTSLVGPTLYNMGYRCVTNIDIDAAAMDAMAHRFAALSEMQFVAMDACDTKVPAQSFGLIFDKALLDTLIADQPLKAEQYLRECQRLLTPGGSLVVISHGVPEKRLPLLAQALRVNPAVNIQVRTVPKPRVPGFELGASSDYFVYEIRV